MQLYHSLKFFRVCLGKVFYSREEDHIAELDSWMAPERSCSIQLFWILEIFDIF